MENTIINSQVNCVGCHLLYSYNFLNLSNFFIELMEITVKEDAGAFYPRVVHAQGEVPDSKEGFLDMNEEDFANKLLQDAGFSEDGDDQDDMFEDLDDYENYE